MKKPNAVLLLLASVVVLLAVTMIGCATPLKATPDALVVAACPPLGSVALVTPADSWRALTNDAEQYNTCRCAALRNTSQACKVDPQPAP